MFTIAPVGGIACGKSTVTKQFRALGCGVINADEIAHKVINYPEIIDQMCARWRLTDLHNVTIRSDLKPLRNSFFLPGGRSAVNRKAVAEIVFSYPEERKFLETIMHPLIDAEIRQSLARYNDVYTPAVILDIPLLFEGHWHKLANYIVYVECNDYQRVKNYAMRTDGSEIISNMAMDDFKKREQAQWPLKKKLDHSHGILENMKDIKSLKEEVIKLWDSTLVPKILETHPINQYIF